MLNRNQILDKLKNLNFPENQYCVMTGAALVLHGVRSDTTDIDIGCTSKLFKELLHRGFELIEKESFEAIVIDGCIEIFEDWVPEKIELIEGIPVADINSIRQYKERLGRDKDIRDIELIDKFLEQKTNYKLSQI
ncbi:MAG: hypothetical protein WBL93_04175 [Lutisporaceae bacterium]